MTLRAVRTAGSPERARDILADALPPEIAAIVEPAELEGIRARLARLPEPPMHARMTKEDWTGAAAVFLLVFLSTFPVVIPFIVMRNAMPALRVSNAIAVAMLFMTGYTYGGSPGIAGRHGDRDGRARHGPRRHHDGARRVRHMRVVLLAALAIVLAGGTARAQATTGTPAAAAPRPRSAGPSTPPLHLHPSGRSRLRAARRHSRSRMAAPRGALQLRGPRHRIRVVWLQFRRR